MGLPKKTLLVLPNPWTLIDPELGPVGRCTRDTGGRGGDVIYLGSELRFEELEKREGPDGKPDRRQLTWLDYPALDASLTKGTGITVPKTPYYLDRLRDGSLVPADEATFKASGAKFKNLLEAKKEAVAAFDAEHGEGSWKELEALLAEEAKAEAEANKPKAEPEKKGGSGGGSGGSSGDGGKS